MGEEGQDQDVHRRRTVPTPIVAAIQPRPARVCRTPAPISQRVIDEAPVRIRSSAHDVERDAIIEKDELA
jgi:hypothetical protein